MTINCDWQEHGILKHKFHLQAKMILLQNSILYCYIATIWYRHVNVLHLSIPLLPKCNYVHTFVCERERVVCTCMLISYVRVCVCSYSYYFYNYDNFHKKSFWNIYLNAVENSSGIQGQRKCIEDVNLLFNFLSFIHSLTFNFTFPHSPRDSAKF